MVCGAWRALPADFLSWQTVYGFFLRWERVGVTARLNDVSRDKLRVPCGPAPAPTLRPPGCWNLRGCKGFRKY